MENFKRLILRHSEKALFMCFKKIFQSLALIIVCLCCYQVNAQTRLLLKTEGEIPYVEYVVQPGETLSGIAKQFGSDIGTTMRFNHFNAQSKLVIGSVVKVPVNFAALKSTAGANTALVHVVGKGETLYRISVNHNKVPVDLLKQWNNLKDNSISQGQEIVVAYINSNATAQAPAVETPTETAAVSQPKQETISTPAVSAPKTVTPSAPVSSPAVVEEKQFELNKPEPTPTPTKEAIPEAEKKETAQQAKFELSEKVKEQEAKINANKVSDNGFFAPLFGIDVEGRSVETVAGTGMTFKTSAGWSDKKYYILMNDIPPGSIVKISNGNKVVYARVLWNLGGLKENEGLDFRISNAAAAALGLAESKFQIQVTYYE